MTTRRAVSALFLANGAILGTWVSRIPAVQAARGLSHAQIGLALLAMAGGALVSMPLSGAWSGRIGTRRVCAGAGLLYCGILPLLPLMPGAAALGALLFAFGAVHGALDVAMNAEAVAEEKRRRRPIMSSFHALFSVGGLAGAAAGGGLASLGVGAPAHFLMGAIGCGTLMAFASASLPVTSIAAPAKGAGRPEGASADWKRRGEPPPRLRAGAGRAEGAFSGWKPPRGTLLALGAVAFCSMIGEGSMADWSALFLRDVRHASEGGAALGYACFSIAMALGRIAGDRLIARFGPSALLRAGGAAAALGVALALTGPGAAAALAGFAIAGLGFATIVPIVFTASGQVAGLAPEQALAAVSTTGYAGFLIGPPLIGLLASAFGLRLALGVIVATSATCAALAGIVRPGRAAATPAEPLTAPRRVRMAAAR